MDRLRRSLRDSFRKKKDSVPECSKPHQWQSDDAAVRNGTCSFSVKYLGCVEVFESRGMQVCEEALVKILKNIKRRPVKGTLYVTGDGLRVVDDETKGLIVDQTIEKVSFCAPDINCDKGFSYICRDGTTRRWMCHCFLAVRDTGERLSHAVGCAFAVCLERKQKRDKETVVMTFDTMSSTFNRTGSFRQISLIERMQDPQECKLSEPPPIKPVCNPYAVERPHATAVMIQRQGSFRGFTTLNQTSPFKRQLSLRLNELPSTIERRAMTEHGDIPTLQNGLTVASIPESSPTTEKQDTINVICQQISQGVSLLNKKDNSFKANAITENQSASQNLNSESKIANHWSGGDVCSQAETWLTNASVSLNAGNYKAQTFMSHSSQSDSNTSELLMNRSPVHAMTSHPIVPPRHSSPNFSHLQKETINTLHNENGSVVQSEQEHEVLNNSQKNSLWATKNVYQSSRDPQASFNDPFDAEWAAIASRNKSNTNPFVPLSVKAFEVHM